MSVADAALMLDVMQQPGARDWTSLPPTDADHLSCPEDGIAGLRVAYSPTLGYVGNVDPERSPPQSRGWPVTSSGSVPSLNRSIPASTIRWRSPPACG
jgi:hypothetical protein